MRTFLTIILFLTCFILPLRAAPGDAKAGQATYTKSCGSCHAADGSPKEAIAKMLKVEMKNLAAVIHDAVPNSQLAGLLGLNFLSNFRMDIDTQKGLLHLEKK